MSVGFGHQAWIGIATEVTYGTYVAPAKFIEIQEDSIVGKHEIISRPSLRRVSLEHNVKSKKTVEGGFKFQFPFDGSELFLKHAIGSVVTTGGAAPYTHTFTPAALPVGMSIVSNRDADAVGGSSAFQYEGCQVSKMTITQEAEDFAMCGIDVVGEDWNLIAKPTPTFPTFVGADYEMLTTATIAGAAVNVQSVELSIDNGLATDRFKLGSRVRKGLGRASNRVVEGKLTIEFESITEYTFYKNLSNQILILKWTGATLGAGTYSLELNMPKVFFSGSDPTVKGPGPIMMDLPFKAYMSSTDGDELSVILKNNVATVTG